MGDVSGSGGLDELPSRGVLISSFYIGKTEVTQTEFRRLIGFNYIAMEPEGKAETLGFRIVRSAWP